MPGAAIIWEAGDEAEVRAALASLPIAEAGMLEVVALIPLEPYPGFAPRSDSNLSLNGNPRCASLLAVLP